MALKTNLKDLAKDSKDSNVYWSGNKNVAMAALTGVLYFAPMLP